MRRESKRILAAATAFWLVVAGCGALPMAPRFDAGSGAAGSLAASPTGGSASLGSMSPGGPPGPPQPPPQAGDSAMVAVGQIDGIQGGVVHANEVTLAVPPSAFPGDAQIKITIPDSTQMMVHLEITPPEKNHFSVPVRLEFDARSMGKDPRMMVVYWRDPATNQWVAIPTDIDMKTGIVSADLAHFSDYQCNTEVQGRAGW